jgi:protein-tyrosine phosphatase
MIDLHCHILPGLDDGARDIEDSIAMARQAREDGIAVVCATPHIRHDHDVRIEEIATRVSEVGEALVERGIDVRLRPGGELAETEADRCSDAQLHLAALGGAGGWVLLEPAPGPLGKSLEALVGRLEMRGLGTIVAHPERHAGTDFEERLEALVSRGCLIQWTAEFVAQAAEDDLVLRLAREGLVHLLGSDAHSSHAGRPVRLAAGFARLATVCEPARISWMADWAPRAVLRAERFSPPG